MVIGTSLLFLINTQGFIVLSYHNPSWVPGHHTFFPGTAGAFQLSAVCDLEKEGEEEEEEEEARIQA